MADDFLGGRAADGEPIAGTCILEPAADVDVWLRTAFEQSSAGIFVMTPEGRSLLYNSAMESLTGWSLPEICSQPWLDRLFEPEMRSAGEALATAIGSASATYVETPIARRDGSRAWVSFALQPLNAPNRTLVLGTVTDISERKRLEGERRRAVASLEQAYEDLEVVQDLSELAMATLDLGELFDTVLERIIETTGADRAVVLLREGDRLVSRAGVGLHEQIRQGFGMGIGEGFAGIIADTLEPLYMEDAQTDERMLSPFVRAEGVASMYGVPILRRGHELIGVLLVGWLNRHPEDDRELRLLEIVANRVGSAIYNAALYGETSRERTLSQAQNRINAEVSSTLEVDEILRRVAGQTREAIGASGGGVALLEAGELIIRYADGDLAGLLAYRMSSQVTQAIEQIEETTGVLRVTNAYEDERAKTAVTKRFGIGAFLGAPLRVRGEFLGALLLTWPDPVREFSDLDADFLVRVAASVALAIENARLYETQAGISHTLQEALLAVPETVEPLHMGHLYRSATEQAEVGGDFYDVFVIEPDIAAVLIGDVSGKGVQAATLTALCKSVARAFALEGDAPSEILRKSNEVIRASSAVNVFVTMFLALLDTDTGILTYCSAGHPPPLLRRARRRTGHVQQLPGLCPLLGAFGGLQYDDHHETLAAGDVLLMYTDGLIEARAPGGDFYGTERAARFLADIEDPDAETLPARLHQSVLEFTGGTLADDLAILAVSLRG